MRITCLRHAITAKARSAAACPTGAIEKMKTASSTLRKTCALGTGACVDACPFGVPILVKEKNKAVKCDMCRDRIAEGKRPICVEACPLRALSVGRFGRAEKGPSRCGARHRADGRPVHHQPERYHQCLPSR